MRFLLPLLLLFVLPAQSAAKRPIEHFAKLDGMSGPMLSPAGTKIAALISVRGEQALAIIPLGAKADQVAFVSLKDQDLRWVRWVNEDWLISGVGSAEVLYGQDAYITRTVSISADGKTLRPIAIKAAAQFADDLIWTAKDGSPRALVGMQTSFMPSHPGYYPEVYEVNVATGRINMVVGSQRGVTDWYADADGTVRMGIGYNERAKKSFLVYRPDEKQSFRTVDRASWQNDERLLTPQIFTGDPSKALTLLDTSGYEALYELNLDTMTIGAPVYQVNGFDLDGVIADRTGKGLGGVTYTDTRKRVHWFDPDMAAVQKEIDASVGDRAAHIVSQSRDRTKLIVQVGAANEPGAYYYYDRAAGKMQRLGQINQSLGGDRLAPVKTVKYKARDGLEISGILTVPAGREAKNLPLILLPHGGPHVRDEEMWDWWTQFLADRGYAVLQPNYRGSTGFGTEFHKKGLGEWGLKMQDDLVDAVKWAASTGLADPNRVCIAGASYGGYAALRAAQRDSGVYRCAISFAGVADLDAIMRYDRRMLLGDWAKDYWKRQATDFKAVSPIHHAAQFSIPTLIMHGKKDLRVPVKQSRQMADMLKRAGKDHIYIEQPEGDHHFSREEDRLQFLQEMEKFLARHNPA